MGYYIYAGGWTFRTVIRLLLYNLGVITIKSIINVHNKIKIQSFMRIISRVIRVDQ